jgi:hypothetical protein
LSSLLFFLHCWRPTLPSNSFHSAWRTSTSIFGVSTPLATISASLLLGTHWLCIHSWWIFLLSTELLLLLTFCTVFWRSRERCSPGCCVYGVIFFQLICRNTL